MRSLRLFAPFVLLTATYLPADDLPDLSAERPGFSTPSAPVGLGVLQLEQGYTYEWARIGSTTLGTFAAPQAMVRLGLGKTFELRFSTVGYEWQTLRLQGQRKTFMGGNDYVVGAKLRMVRQSEHGFVPEVSLIGGLSLPSRKSPFTSGGFDPYFTLAADKDLPRKFSLVANWNIASVTDPPGRLFSSGESLWLTRNFKPFGLFSEVFRTTISRGLGSEIVADIGCYKSLGKHMQIDAEAGHTIMGLRPSVYASVGLVIRAPRALLQPDGALFHASRNR